MDPHRVPQRRGKACRKTQHRQMGWSAVKWMGAQGIPCISSWKANRKIDSHRPVGCCRVGTRGAKTKSKLGASRAGYIGRGDEGIQEMKMIPLKLSHQQPFFAIKTIFNSLCDLSAGLWPKYQPWGWTRGPSASRLINRNHSTVMCRVQHCALPVRHNCSEDDIFIYPIASRPPRIPQFENHRYSRINNCICATRRTHQKPESESGIGGRWGGTISAICQSEFSGPVGRSQRANKVRRREGETRQNPARARVPSPPPTSAREGCLARARAGPSPGLRPPPRRALPPPG
ncbi:hypothetical protein H8959_022619 [Pygathrix nigripes]